jgi:hypothetical protein
MIPDMDDIIDTPTAEFRISPADETLDILTHILDPSLRIDDK